ncbi:MAG: helix-turn-helix domain-containing protein [Roseburia sp.]|nr:helix-turn-helix domain-containing protein [Roseburia sp.]
MSGTDSPAVCRYAGLPGHRHARLIHQECGCSFSELLHRIRCQTATDFLKYGAGVSETAEKCGYKTSSQFCHAFQKRYGISPKKWQREHT